MKISIWHILLLAVLAVNTALGQSARDREATYLTEILRDTADSRIDLTDADAVFRYVFRQLPETVRVLPSGDQYFFEFKAGGNRYIGNFHLDEKDRNEGYIYFTYSESGQKEASADNKRFGRKEGVFIDVLGRNEYRVARGDHSVLFELQDLSKKKPGSLIGKGERFISRSLDESGMIFLLLFHKKAHVFLWVLDERQEAPLSFSPIDSTLILEERSEFVFYVDTTRSHRKILLGISAENIRQDNYRDGPADQMVYNFTNLFDKRVFFKAYPDLQGKIDSFGRYLDFPERKVRIEPYQQYEHLEQLKDRIRKCRNKTGTALYTCLFTE